VLNNLADTFQRRRNPGCGVAGGQVVIRIKFVVDPQSGLGGPVDARIGSGDPGSAEALLAKAVTAVSAAMPIVDLAPYHGETITVTFDQVKACSD